MMSESKTLDILFSKLKLKPFETFRNLYLSISILLHPRQPLTGDFENAFPV